jgi:PHD/YefM family antitoxin component YafN of YafNO toxin-antitoxin module
MPLILPISDLGKSNEISELAHSEKEPIFITKDGYSDSVVMSSELYDELCDTSRIDRAIYESELETANGGEDVDAIKLFEELEHEFWG